MLFWCRSLSLIHICCLIDGLDQDTLCDLQRNNPRINAGRANQLQQVIRTVPYQKLLYRKINADAAEF